MLCMCWYSGQAYVWWWRHVEIFLLAQSSTTFFILVLGNSLLIQFRIFFLYKNHFFQLICFWCIFLLLLLLLRCRALSALYTDQKNWFNLNIANKHIFVCFILHTQFQQRTSIMSKPKPYLQLTLTFTILKIQIKNVKKMKYFLKKLSFIFYVYTLNMHYALCMAFFYLEICAYHLSGCFFFSESDKKNESHLLNRFWNISW